MIKNFFCGGVFIMAILQQSSGSGSTDMKITKFTAMIQNIDRYLAGRSGSVFMFGGAAAKYKTYAVPQFKRYNSDSFISIMEGIFNPAKTGPLEKIDELALIQIYRDVKNKPGEKNFNEFYRLVFWLLFSASVDDEIFNNELSNIVDLAYCLGFDENLIRDWCKVVAFVIGGGILSEQSPLQLETAEAKLFFLHQNS